MRNNLYLIVVNDGDGGQCKATYKQRCEVFQELHAILTKAEYALAWTYNAYIWQAQNGGFKEHLTTDVLLGAASDIATYYDRHVKELSA